MARKEDAEEAVKDLNPTIDGRRANVNLAYMGAKSRTATLPRMKLVLRKKNVLSFLYSSRLQSPGTHANVSVDRRCIPVCHFRFCF